MSTELGLLEELEAEARYHRERLALYRAKVYSARPTTAFRLRKLEQASDHAEQRLRHAQREVGALPPRGPDHSERGA